MLIVLLRVGVGEMLVTRKRRGRGGGLGPTFIWEDDVNQISDT
jgi:hypothetical protein